MEKMTYEIKIHREKWNRATTSRENENIKIYILDINILGTVAKCIANQ